MTIFRKPDKKCRITAYHKAIAVSCPKEMPRLRQGVHFREPCHEEADATCLPFIFSSEGSLELSYIAVS